MQPCLMGSFACIFPETRIGDTCCRPHFTFPRYSHALIFPPGGHDVATQSVTFPTQDYVSPLFCACWQKGKASIVKQPLTACAILSVDPSFVIQLHSNPRRPVPIHCCAQCTFGSHLPLLLFTSRVWISFFWIAFFFLRVQEGPCGLENGIVLGKDFFKGHEGNATHVFGSFALWVLLVRYLLGSDRWHQSGPGSNSIDLACQALAPLVPKRNKVPGRTFCFPYLAACDSLLA